MIVRNLCIWWNVFAHSNTKWASMVSTKGHRKIFDERIKGLYKTNVFFPPANIWLMLEIQFEKNSDKIKNWFIELTSSLFASVFFANSLSRDLDQLSQGLNCSNINGRHESYASFSLICRHVSGVSTENRSSQIFSNLKGQFDVIEVITKTRSECFSLTLLAKASVPNRSEIFPNSATQSGQEILGLKMCCK